MSSTGAAPAERILAVRGRGGYRQYRIPALAVTPSGTLLAAYDGRPNLDDLPNTIDLLLRRSTDHGHSWGPQQVVRTGTGLDGYGDPSLLVDQDTGRVFLFHAAGTRAGFFESGPGAEPEDDIQHADLSWSDDDGLTWTHHRVTAQLKMGPAGEDRGITGLFAAAGNGIQMHTGPHRGRLVQPFVLLVDGRIRAASALSDDHGHTWRLGQFVPDSAHGAGANENKVVCLADGRLLLHSRATPHRLAATSTDGGESWSALTPVDDLPDPSNNGSLARFDGLPTVAGLAHPGTHHWLIATHNHDPHLRHNTVLRLSTDNGATWPHTLALCAGSSAYSTATRLPNGRIGVLYERSGYREIVFTTVDAEAVVRSGPLPPRSTSGGLEFDMVLRSVTPARPARWQHRGESHELAATSDQFDVHTWKEVGQGHSPGQAQVLSTREANDLNYGQVTAAFQVGDILAFTGRVRNTADATVDQVTLHGPHDNPGAFPPCSLSPSEHHCYFTPTYTICQQDITTGTFGLTFTVTGTVNGRGTRSRQSFSVDAREGKVSTTTE